VGAASSPHVGIGLLLEAATWGFHCGVVLAQFGALADSEPKNPKCENCPPPFFAVRLALLLRTSHQRQALPLRSLSPNVLVMPLGGHPLSVHAFYGVSAEQQPTVKSTVFFNAVDHPFHWDMPSPHRIPGLHATRCCFCRHHLW
jgi:hypothetical protein